MSQCAKCLIQKGRKFERHHITYEPEITVTLCDECHIIITNINTLIAKNYTKKKLTNEQRETLYDFFIASPKWITKSLVPNIIMQFSKEKDFKNIHEVKPKNKKTKHFKDREYFLWCKNNKK